MLPARLQAQYLQQKPESGSEDEYLIQTEGAIQVLPRNKYKVLYPVYLGM